MEQNLVQARVKVGAASQNNKDMNQNPDNILKGERLGASIVPLDLSLSAGLLSLTRA